MDDRVDKGIEDLDPRITHDVIKNILKDPPPSFVGDINFEETPTGYEVWYSDRLASEHQDLVDQSADWLENEMGVINLGQIDYKILLADGPLTDEIRDGLIAWWAERVHDLDLR
jgi:hypothetical protein